MGLWVRDPLLRCIVGIVWLFRPRLFHFFFHCAELLKFTDRWKVNPLRLQVVVQVRGLEDKRFGWCLYTFIVLFHVCTHRTKQQYEHSCSSQCSRDMIMDSKKHILFILFIYKYLFMLSVWQHVSMLAIEISWYSKRLLYFTLNFLWSDTSKKEKSYIFKQSTFLLPRFRLWQSIYRKVTFFPP